MCFSFSQVRQGLLMMQIRTLSSVWRRSGGEDGRREEVDKIQQEKETGRSNNQETFHPGKFVDRLGRSLDLARGMGWGSSQFTRH